ncbi:hypothetical protein KHP62_07520 [Rhodobacteraceae bacterium NNCM2]|nr:hypothetical protein [Coraliihabitans acroporae]
MPYRFLIVGLIIFLPSGSFAEEEERQVQGYNPPPPKEGYSYPDCYCTDSTGERVEMGESACLHIGSRRVWARCDMSLNNPIWRESGESCPSV